MTERAAQSLASTKTPFIIINRSLDKAQILADRFGCLCLPLNEFCRKPPRIEVVFSCTGSSHAIIKESTLERLAAQTESGQAPLLIDMSVPADIDPVACTKLALKRIGMDEITKEAQANRLVRLNKTPQARELVDYALIRFHEKFAEQVYGELFGVLQQRYQHTAKEGVQRLLKKELKDLGPKQREAIESWSRVLARRFAHIPTLGLRGLLYEGPEGSLDAFLEGLDPKFASELRSAVNRGLQQQEETGS
jgi:glutamyl-tRNA reductase